MTCVDIGDAAHFVTLDQPAPFAAALKAFVEAKWDLCGNNAPAEQLKRIGTDSRGGNIAGTASQDANRTAQASNPLTVSLYLGQLICSTRCARVGPGSNRSEKY